MIFSFEFVCHGISVVCDNWLIRRCDCHVLWQFCDIPPPKTPNCHKKRQYCDKYPIKNTIVTKIRYFMTSAYALFPSPVFLFSTRKHTPTGAYPVRVLSDKYLFLFISVLKHLKYFLYRKGFNYFAFVAFGGLSHEH